jgi:putative ABC transport system ATP-binding protein
MSDLSLKINKITKSYFTASSQVKALKYVSISVQLNELLALHGASGSGKSTLLYAIAGLLTVDAGDISLCGKNLTSMSQAVRTKFRADHIGLVFQDFRLVPYLDVLGNVMLATNGSADAKERAEQWLEKVGISERKNHRPSQLSTGEQQRCAMARALVNDPYLILADEPTGNLDAENSAIILGFLKQFAESGKLVIMATHDPSAVKAATRIAKMKDGELLI